MKGLITISLGDEKYYKWTEILFRSVNLFSTIPLCVVYDNDYLLKKYNLDKLAQFCIKREFENPYLLKYKLINYTPFTKTIFLDADTIITRDINELFNEQFVGIYGEWDKQWLYKHFSFVNDPTHTVRKYKLPRFLSAYSGYLSFDQSDYYRVLFDNVLSKVHYDSYYYKIYGREVMPDEYFLDLVVSNYELNKFTPIQLNFSNLSTNEFNFYGYSHQGTGNIRNNRVNKVLKDIKMTLTNTLI